MNVIFIGPPGAGKGTQAKILCDKYNLFQVSTGDILRKAIQDQTSLGLKAQEYMNAGNLVPDEVMIGIIKEVLVENKNGNFLLDGFPRNKEQAEFLDSILEENNIHINYVIYLKIDSNTVIERLIKRAALENRQDDTPDVVQNRIMKYEESTIPVLNYYKSKNLLYEVLADQSVEDVSKSIYKIIDKEL